MSKHTPTPWVVTKTTVYAVNDRGVNRFYANVQPGTLDNQNRTPHAELICAAVNSYAKLPDPLEAAKEDVLGEALELVQRLLDQSYQSSWAHITSHPCSCKDCTRKEARALLATQERTGV